MQPTSGVAAVEIVPLAKTRPMLMITTVTIRIRIRIAPISLSMIVRVKRKGLLDAKHPMRLVQGLTAHDETVVDEDEDEEMKDEEKDEEEDEETVAAGMVAGALAVAPRMPSIQPT